MFKGLGNLGNIASLMGSLQQIPEKMQELTERLKLESVSGSAADGNVIVIMNGVGQVQSVKIDGDLVGAQLELAIVEASNEAGAAAKQLFADSVSRLASDLDLNIPGVEGLLTNFGGGG